MRIIIVGCGKVGSELAGQLSAAGHDLTLVDLSERRLEELSNTHDLATVKGSGTSYHVLREAGVQDTDLLIAVTAHDEINLLSCLIARKASGCHAIARVRDPEYVSDLGFIRDELGISMVINPELSTARVVSRLIRFPSAIRVSTFARGRIELLDLKIPHESRLDGMAVCEVNPLLRTDVLLCMVRRDGQTYIPKGDFILRENDNITDYHSRRTTRANFSRRSVCRSSAFPLRCCRRRQNLVLSCENPAEFRHCSQDYRKQTRTLRSTVRNAPERDHHLRRRHRPQPAR